MRVGEGESSVKTVRNRLKPEERRAQLIALGLEMLSERPIDEVSVEAIAESAGISRGLLFHYFPSKRDFHFAVAQAAAEELLERTMPDTALPPLERLAAGIEQFVDYVIAKRDAYVSLVSGAAGADPDLARLFDVTRQTNADRLVESLVEIGVPSNARLRVTARAWVAFIEEATVHALTRNELGRAELLEYLWASSLPVLSVGVDDPNLVDRLLSLP